MPTTFGKVQRAKCKDCAVTETAECCCQSRKQDSASYVGKCRGTVLSLRQYWGCWNTEQRDRNQQGHKQGCHRDTGKPAGCVKCCADRAAERKGREHRHADPCNDLAGLMATSP